MYPDYGYDVEAERRRRKLAGIPTLRWYKCHGCGMEYSMARGVRGTTGCVCITPDVHIHSDLDGEKPSTLGECYD